MYGSSNCGLMCGYAALGEYRQSPFSYRPGAPHAYASKVYEPPKTSHASIDDLARAPHALTLAHIDVPERYQQGTYLSKPQSKDYFIVDQFLTHSQPTEFVNEAKEIEEHGRAAFLQTTGRALPKNIAIHLCSEAELRKAHERSGGRWSAGIQGFSINRGLHGVSDVFVKKDFLDKVMLTLGHEIGHVLSPTLGDARDEEAKAFAFSIAWMRAIVENNIAGLTNAINPSPAQNGLHDVGFAFVEEQMALNKISAFDVFMQLAEGVVSITKRLEQISIA